MTAAAGLTKAHGPVIATRPPSRPLQTMATSGFRRLYQTYTSAAKAPAREASMLLTAIAAMGGSAPASVGPAPSPNRPTPRLTCPTNPLGRLDPRRGPRLPRP